MLVRVAELSDAAHLLALYVEHYRASMCTFAPTRAAARQVHYLKSWPEDHITLLAFNRRWQTRGIFVPIKEKRTV